MAYGNRSYSSGDFDFDGKDPGDGGFFSELFDSGKVMVGWGRRRTKWVKLDQAEVVNFLTHAPTMIVTDDVVLKGMLTDLARRLATAKEITATELIAAVESGDEVAGQRLVRLSELILEGRSKDEAMKVLNAEIRDAA